MMTDKVNNTNLSNQQYRVIVLKHRGNMSTSEIAKELDIRHSTVRTVIRKARVKMNKAKRTTELMDELGIESH